MKRARWLEWYLNRMPFPLFVHRDNIEAEAATCNGHGLREFCQQAFNAGYRAGVSAGKRKPKGIK